MADERERLLHGINLTALQARAGVSPPDDIPVTPQLLPTMAAVDYRGTVAPPRVPLALVTVDVPAGAQARCVSVRPGAQGLWILALQANTLVRFVFRGQNQSMLDLTAPTVVTPRVFGGPMQSKILEGAIVVGPNVPSPIGEGFGITVTGQLFGAMDNFHPFFAPPGGFVEFYLQPYPSLGGWQLRILAREVPEV